MLDFLVDGGGGGAPRRGKEKEHQLLDQKRTLILPKKKEGAKTLLFLQTAKRELPGRTFLRSKLKKEKAGFRRQSFSLFYFGKEAKKESHPLIGKENHRSGKEEGIRSSHSGERKLNS